MSKFPKSGFTLIELLVVITIIAILSTTAYAVYGGIQSRTHDSKRKTDLDSIAHALESHYTAGKYPVLTDEMFEGRKIPIDPQNTADHNDPVNNDFSDGYNYKYTYETTFQNITQTGTSTDPWTAPVTTFVVCAKLENKNGNFADHAGATPASGSEALYYCRRNEQ